MRIVVVEDDNADRAQKQIAQDLGIASDQVKFIKKDGRRSKFEVLFCPPSIEVEISRDAMKAVIRRIRLPIGDKAPRLTTEFVVELLKAKGVKLGIKTEILSKEIYKILNTPGFDDEALLSLPIAEGQAPVTAQGGKPQWLVNEALFKGKEPVMAKKGEVVAKSGRAVKGVEGFRVTGEPIKALVEEQFKLNVSPNIEVRQTELETLYVTKSFGRLLFDEGIRMRLDSKLVALREGLDAGVECTAKSFTGAKITAEDLLEFAKEQGVKFGSLEPKEIEAQLKAAKQWPATIVVARGQEPKNGKPGDLIYVYTNPVSQAPLDIEKAKEKIVFPGDEIMIVKGPFPPTEGRTAYGELLKGKPYDELPLYPGKGASKERRGEDTVFKATNYGRVLIEKERVNVENILQLNPNKMEASLDVFPQKSLSGAELQTMLREKDVLFGVEKEKLDEELKKIHQRGLRISKFTVARGKPILKGSDAKVELKFDPEDFKEKGLFQKKAPRIHFILPGDLILTKTHPVEAQEGMNIYREKMPIPPAQVPKDIVMKHGENIKEVDVGEYGSETEPLRTEYRAECMGILVWKEGFVDIQPTLSFSKDEKEAKMRLAHKSTVAGPLTEDILKKIAEEEGIKVELEWPSIRKAIQMSKEREGALIDVIIAKAQEPKHGENARIQYFVEFNGRPIDASSGQKKGADEKPVFCDCVRPGDVLAMKTPAALGEDGKTIFGRRLPADRGRDEPFFFGSGVEKSKDGLQLYCNLSFPGFVVIESGRILVRSSLQIAAGKMKASLSLYPSKNPRFMVKEDKVMAMIHGAGVTFGIKTMAIREALENIVDEPAPVMDLVVAEGRAPQVGREAFFKYAIDAGDNAGEARADGSIDYKNRNVFQTVKKGQLLMIKQPAVVGSDGFDVTGAILHGKLGADVSVNAGAGVEVSLNGLEYRSMLDGIVEILPKSIRVIPGLYIATDIGPKTGNVNAQSAQVFIKGGVLPDFEVVSNADIVIEKAAEACRVLSKANIKIKGGIIGKNKGFTSAGGNLETIYISAGAQVEVIGDALVRNEILNSKIIVGGFLTCDEKPGVIMGGQIHSFKGVKARTLGAAGAETPTVITLGQNIFELREAEQKIEETGLGTEIRMLEEELSVLNKDLQSIYDQIPEMMKTDVKAGQELQNRYRSFYAQKQEKTNRLAALTGRRDEILGKVSVNSDFVVSIGELAHPGTTFIYKGLKWVLKEPVKSVEIRWNVATSNFVSRRL